MGLPQWVLRWHRSGDCGISSESLCYHMLGSEDLVDLHRYKHNMDAPYDQYDLCRCLDLITLAAKHGLQWRERIHEMAVYPAWAPLVGRWQDLEEAHSRDAAARITWDRERYATKDGGRRARPRKDIPYPPSESGLLIRQLRNTRLPFMVEKSEAL